MKIDHDLLLAVIAGMEADADDIPDEATSEEFMRRLLNLSSQQGLDALAEVAVGRAMQALAITTGEQVDARRDDLETGTQLFLDGFIVGARYSQGRDKP